MKKNYLTGCIIWMILCNAAFAQVRTPLHPPPVPYFYITGLCFGDTTHFINHTDIGSIRWSITTDKGDTIYRAVGDQAAYYFKKRGAYNVCLTADNGHLATKIRTVIVDTITKADFSFRYCYDVFDNLSACSDQYVWVLPDGSSTTAAFPAYKFTRPGVYPVKLVAIRGNRKDTLLKSISIRGDSLGAPNANFTFRKIGEPAVYEFTAMDSLADNYSWYFGDQKYDDTSGFKVIHSIDLETYDGAVDLWMSNGCGAANFQLDPIHLTRIKENSFEESVVVYPDPAADELHVNFSNGSTEKDRSIKLMDLRGRVLIDFKQEQVQNEDVLHIGSLPAGMYILQIGTERSRWNKKIVIAH